MDEFKVLRKYHLGNSLAVQLGLSAFTAMVQGQSLFREIRAHKLKVWQKKKKKKNIYPTWCMFEGGVKDIIHICTYICQDDSKFLVYIIE